MKRFNETYGKRKFLSRNEWADTYKAIHSKTEEKVIVKVLVNKSHDEVYINNLSKDIEILKNINSPNLIHVHDMFQYSACGKNYYYIESEYFKGITLKEKLESEKFSQKEAVKIVEQIAEVLKEFHNSNLSFDTLDLESILINSKNLVKIDILSYLENKKFIVNMEENTEIVAFNPENDIYSIGVILYNLLSGKTVFEKEKYKKDINDINLARVIEKSTNNEIENKYKNIDRLIIDLKSYLLCGEIKDDSYDDEIKVNVKSKNKKDKKVKKKKEKVDKKKNKNKKEKIIKEEVVKEDIEKKEEKTEKKGKVGKTLGICAAVAIVAGAGVYAYDSIQKNNNLEAEENKTQIEENIKVQEEESEKVDTKVEDKTEDVVKEENTTKETSKEKQESSSSTKKNSTTKKKENSTSSSSNSNKNNESSSNSNSGTSNSNNNSSTNKPSNNTTNKPSNNTNNSGSSTSKPENNNNNSSTTTKPDKEESTPEVPPTTDDSNSNSGNDSEASPETPEVELEN